MQPPIGLFVRANPVEGGILDTVQVLAGEVSRVTAPEGADG